MFGQDDIEGISNFILALVLLAIVLLCGSGVAIGWIICALIGKS